MKAYSIHTNVATTFLYLMPLVLLACTRTTLERSDTGDPIQNDGFAVTSDIVLMEPANIVYDEPRYFHGIADGPIAIDTNYWGPSPTALTAWPARVSQLAVDDANTLSALTFEIKVGVFGYLSEVDTWFDATDGHSKIPQQPPTVEIVSYQPGLGPSNDAIVSLARLDVTADNVNAYERRHPAHMHFDPYPMLTPGQRILVRIVGEYGDDAKPGLVVDTPTYVYTSTAIGAP